MNDHTHTDKTLQGNNKIESAIAALQHVRKIWLPRILHVRIKANNNPSAFAITVTTNMFFSVYIKEFKNALSDKIFL